MKQVVAGIASSATSEYIRASCAYCARNGLNAISTAANHAARCVPQICRPAHQAAGIASSANSSDSPRTPASVRPATSSQKCSSM